MRKVLIDIAVALVPFFTQASSGYRRILALRSGLSPQRGKQ
jgi:hypothetical protein